MSTLTLVKRIERVSPTLLDLLQSAVTGGNDIFEYDPTVNYTEGAYVYIVNEDGTVVIYKAITDITSTGTFNPLEWVVVNGLGDYSGIVISETEPTNPDIDSWFKPLRYMDVDIENITMEIDPYYIDYRYKYNNTLYQFSNLPVGASVENTTAVVYKLLDAPTLVGRRSLSETINGFYIEGIETAAFEGYTELTSFDTNTLSYIDPIAFKGCTSLSEVVFGEYFTTIGDNAFEGCTSLTTITVNNPNTTFGTNAFKDTALATIKGHSGSTAEAFATAGGYTFEALS